MTKRHAQSKRVIPKDSQLIEPFQTGNVGPLVWSGIVLSTFLGIYLKCVAPSVPTGDGGDFIMAAYFFGVAHPPGYPLFVSLGHVFSRLVTWGSPAYKINLMTSILGGWAGFVAFLVTYRLTGFVPSGILASALFTFSRVTWYHSVIAEIFALNNLLCGLILLWVIKFHRASNEDKTRVAMEASFISGLSMCNQHTSILFIAPAGAWMFTTVLRNELLSVKDFIVTGLCFGLGLTPYLQLPFSSIFSNALLTYGQQSSGAGFFGHILRSDYGTFKLTGSETDASFLQNITMFMMDFITEFGLVASVLLIMCFVQLRQFHDTIRTVVKVYIGVLVSYLLYFCCQANIDTTSELLKGVLERFWMQPNLVLCVLVGCGLYGAHQSLCKLLSDKCQPALIYYLFLILSVITATTQIQSNYRTCNLSQDRFVDHLSRKVLQAVPPNSILIIDGDVQSFPFRYVRYVEGVRSDIDVVDVSLMSYWWFKKVHPKLYNHFIYPVNRTMLKTSGEKLSEIRNTKPAARTVFDIEDVFDVHFRAGTPVCVYPETSVNMKGVETYTLIPRGMLLEVRPTNDTYTLDEYMDTEFDREFTVDTILCNPQGLHDRSWERMLSTHTCKQEIFSSLNFVLKQLTTRGSPYHDCHEKYKCTGILLKIYHGFDRVHELSRGITDPVIQAHFFPKHAEFNYGLTALLNYQHHLKFGNAEEYVVFGNRVLSIWGHYIKTAQGQSQDLAKMTGTLADIRQKLKQSDQEIDRDPGTGARSIPGPGKNLW